MISAPDRLDVDREGQGDPSGQTDQEQQRRSREGRAVERGACERERNCQQKHAGVDESAADALDMNFGDLRAARRSQGGSTRLRLHAD